MLGRLRRAALEGDPAKTADVVMEPGPSTIRRHSHLEPLAERMRTRNLTCLPFTTPDRVVIGVVRRDDLDAALASGRP
jgi:predicted transcriptional regulator